MPHLMGLTLLVGVAPRRKAWVGSPAAMLSSAATNGSATKYVTSAIAHLLSHTNLAVARDRFKLATRVAIRDGGMKLFDLRL